MIALIPARAGSKRLGVFPCSQSLNRLDGCPADAEHPREQRARHALASANDNHLLCRQLRQMLIFSAVCSEQSDAIGVQDVFAARYILQVVGVIVRWVAINVVDFLSVWARTYERCCHKAMDFALEIVALFSQVDGEVSAFAARRFQQTSDVRSLTGPRTSNIAAIRDLVPALEGNHIAPFFMHGDIVSRIWWH